MQLQGGKHFRIDMLKKQSETAMESSNTDNNPEIRQMMVSNFDQIKNEKTSTNKIYQTYDQQTAGLTSRNHKSQQVQNLISENSNCTDLQVHLLLQDDLPSKNSKDKHHMALNITDIATIAKNQMNLKQTMPQNVTGRHYGFNSYSQSKGRKVHTKHQKAKTGLPKIYE